MILDSGLLFLLYVKGANHRRSLTCLYIDIHSCSCPGTSRDARLRAPSWPCKAYFLQRNVAQFRDCCIKDDLRGAAIAQQTHPIWSPRPYTQISRMTTLAAGSVPFVSSLYCYVQWRH